MSKLLVPLGFKPPIFKSYLFQLVPLKLADLAEDLKLVQENKDFIESIGGASFPEELDEREDALDLSWHQREFEYRTSFAYKVIDNQNNSYIGCCYIYGADLPFIYARLPKDFQEFEAAISWWTSKESYDNDLYTVLGQEIFKWITESWPFKAVYFTNKILPNGMESYWVKKENS